MKYLTDRLALPADSEPIPAPFQPITALPLVILVGLTGVGKSTVVDALQRRLDFRLLPNRRDLTDAIIISAEQSAAGEAPQPVTDRLKRFDYTARYRARHPGGMSHALSRLAVNPQGGPPRLLFDGLRGLNEVQHAAAHFPQARFVVLDAPDMVRLTRLLGRGDAFDQVALQGAPPADDAVAALRAIKDIEAVFSEADIRQIAGAARAAGWSAADVTKKTAIIVEERRNYDPALARIHLQQSVPPERLLVVNTEQHPAAEVAALVRGWLEG
ncbi:MAG: ATPase [Anaerolineae bacterium]